MPDLSPTRSRDLPYPAARSSATPIDIQPIDDSSVPRGTARLRIAPSPFHHAAHMETLAAASTET